MKKNTLLLLSLCMGLNAFSQFTNIVLPTQVKTNASAEDVTNTYTITFDYDVVDQAGLDEMGYATVRIRPITAAGAKDSPANTDLNFLTDFIAYVNDNGFTGTYTGQIVMPTDAFLPTTESRNAANAGFGYDTRLQWGTTVPTNFQSVFSAIEVFDSSVTLSTKDFNTNKLEATFYSSDRDALIVNDRVSGEFKIYNLLGQSVLKGEISNNISVETLNSGLYILSTEVGVLKFTK